MASQQNTAFFGHPIGLAILFFTEMWERFSYYGMRALLVLFIMADPSTGGFGWSQNEALTLYGWYTMAVYLMSVPGGILADRVFGQRKMVMIGGFLLVAGHGLMAYTEQWAFFAALTLIVLGVGGLKPNISTLVGELYEDGDKRRDSGFTFYYMGINLGSILATTSVAVVADEYGWHYGFGLAGIGMLLGQFTFIMGQKYLAGAGDFIKPIKTENQPKQPFTPQEKDRIIVLLISFVIVCVFWMAFEQAGGLMTIYTQQYTDRSVFGVWEMPTAMFQGFNAGFILIFGTVVSGIWVALRNRGKMYSDIFKMGVGTVIMGFGFIFMLGASMQVEVSPEGNVLSRSALWWVVFAYLFHTLGELCLSPVSLSYITKVAPKRIVASMMGLYWAVVGLANKLASEIGKLATEQGEVAVFGGLVVFTVVMGSLLILFRNKIDKLTHGSDKINMD